MSTTPIAGLVSKAKKTKPKADGFAVQVSGDHAAVLDYLTSNYRNAVRKATGRSPSRIESRAQIAGLFFDAFFSGSKILVVKIDEDNDWQSDLGPFSDWAALAAALPKEGENTPEEQGNAAGQEGDSRNQEDLTFETDEQGAGTHQASSEEEEEGAAGSEEELSEMEKLERELNAQNA